MGTYETKANDLIDAYEKGIDGEQEFTQNDHLVTRNCMLLLGASFIADALQAGFESLADTINKCVLGDNKD